MYWLQKTSNILLTLVLVSFITFATLYILPGDPAQLILGTEAEPQAVETLRNQLGLDLPWWQQYLSWATDMTRGDMGRSLTFSRGYPISELIVSALPVTLALALSAVLLAFGLSLLLGISAAAHQGSWWDNLVLTLSQLGISVPAFWVGILLIQFFALRLGWLPPGGMPSWSNAGAAIAALVLPTLALAMPRAGIMTRLVRSAMLDILSEDYIRTARSKGLSERVVLLRHGLKNAMVSIMTVSGIQLVQLLAGAIVIEQVFSLPGLGRLLLVAVMLRDLPLVQGLVFTGTALVLFTNFSLDMLYPLLDPRITRQGVNHGKA